MDPFKTLNSKKLKRGQIIYDGSIIDQLFYK